jgi:hypothetical protein
MVVCAVFSLFGAMISYVFIEFCPPQQDDDEPSAEEEEGLVRILG